jgi:hypothetical protein
MIDNANFRLVVRFDVDQKRASVNAIARAPRRTPP